MKITNFFRRIAMGSFLVFTAGVTATQGADGGGVKETYFLKLPQYVDWPSSAFPEVFSDFVLGVLGDDDFANNLAETEQGKWLDGRPVSVRQFHDFDRAKSAALRQCHILFISVSQTEHLKEILKLILGTPILTVSDIKDFPSQGGMIQFDQEGQRLVLIINLAAVKNTKMDVSSRLLRVAKLYGKP